LTIQRFNDLANDLVRLQNKREIDTLAFGDVESSGGKGFPIRRRVQKCFGHQTSRQNHEARSIFFHELRGARRIQRRHPTFYLRPKIPNQTRLLEINPAEFRFRSQLFFCLPKKLRGWKKSGGDRRDEKRNEEIDRRCCCGTSFQKLRAIDQVPREQKRKQRKGRKRVMRQLCFDQGEDDKNNPGAGEKVDVDLFAFAPKLF